MRLSTLLYKETTSKIREKFKKIAFFISTFSVNKKFVELNIISEIGINVVLKTELRYTKKNLKTWFT